jgi:hypothetical protein
MASRDGERDTQHGVGETLKRGDSLPAAAAAAREPLLEQVSYSNSLAKREGSYLMEQVLCQPVELTEFELDSVTGGAPFSINVSAFASSLLASLPVVIDNHPTTTILNFVDNSINISGL